MSLFTKVSAAAILTASAALAPAVAAQPQPTQPSEVEAPDDLQDAATGIGTRIIVYGAAKDPASAGMPPRPKTRACRNCQSSMRTRRTPPRSALRPGPHFLHPLPADQAG
jgi:hypothetical protein